MAEGQSASSLAAFAYQPASNLAVQREPSPEAAVDAPPQTVSHDPFASDSGSAASADEQEAAGEPQAGQPPPARAGEEPEEAPADTAEASSPAAAPVRSPEAADSARRAEAPDRPAQNPAEAAAGHDEPNRPVLSMKLADPPTNGVPVVEAVGSDLPKGEQEEASEEEEQESEEEEEEESEGYQEGSEESGEESEAYEEESGEESEEEEESEDDEAPRRKPGRAKKTKVDYSAFLEEPELYGIRRSGRARHSVEHFEVEEAPVRPRRSKTGDSRKGRKRNAFSSSSSGSGSTSEEESDDGEEWGAPQRRARSTRVKTPSAKRRPQQQQGSDEDWGPRANSRKSGRSRKVTSYADPSSEESVSDISADERRERAAYQAQREAEKLKPGIDMVVKRLTQQQRQAQLEAAMAQQAADGAEPDAASSATAASSRMTADMLTSVPREEYLYFIKWQGLSHLHNTWHTEEELMEMDIRGQRKVTNYIKAVEEDMAWLREASKEDAEHYFCNVNRHQDMLEQHTSVERIIASKESAEDGGDPQDWADYRTLYLCKWDGLPYADATWEDTDLISGKFQAQVDGFLDRAASRTRPTAPKMQKAHSRPAFKRIEKQPDWIDPEVLQLRDYQMESLNWLVHKWCNGKSSILADEMGLGKTIQSISFINYLFNRYNLTIVAWGREFTKWAPDLNVIMYQGNRASRELIQEHELWTEKRKPKFNVLLTSFEMVTTDREVLGMFPWACLMVDEAHRLKNQDSLLHKVLCTFRTDHRLLITGTPLQNTLEELWALLNFIEPGQFGDWETFHYEYGDGKSPEKVAALHQLLKPYLLRRVKKDVEKSLPQKTEQILRVDLSTRQKQLYKHILSRNYLELRNMTGTKSSLLNVLMQLKKTCNHALLIETDVVSQNSDDDMRRLLAGSGKLMLLDQLLARLKKDGHRVLIFSQMVMMLDVLSEYLRRKGYRHQRLDGSTNNDLRKHAMDHFNAEGSEDFCFLLSTRAGGLGINLATADTVIIFDSDWNPQNDLQAMARAHRIGQKRQVSVFRLVTKGTVEEDILEKARQKRVLDTLVIQQMDTSGRSAGAFNHRRKSSANTPDFKKEDMDRIIKFGAMELFKDTSEQGGVDGEPAGDSVDLDEILRRAEKTDTAEAASQGAGEELLSQFKTVDIAVDMEEPSWDAIIPEEDRRREEERAQEEKMKALQLGPRKRTAVKYTGADDEAGASSSRSRKDKDRSERAPSSKDAVVPELQAAGLGDITAGMMKSFMTAVRKFGAGEERLPLVVEEAGLRALGEGVLPKLVAWVREGARAAEAKGKEASASERASPKAPANGKGVKKEKKQAAWSVAGKPYNPTELLLRLDGLAALHKVLKANKDTFRLPKGVKPPVAWDVKWNTQTDSLLLRGIDQHGFGSWEKIKADPQLKGLAGSLLPEDSRKKPQRGHLEKRGQTLLKHLLQSSMATAARRGVKKPAKSGGTAAGKASKMGPLTFSLGKAGKKLTAAQMKAAAKAAAESAAASEEDFKVTKRRVEQAMKPVAKTLQRMRSMSDSNPTKLDLLYEVGLHIRSEIDRVSPDAQGEMQEALWEHAHGRSGFKDYSAKLLRGIWKTLRKERKGKGIASKSPSSSGGARAPKRKEGSSRQRPSASGAKRPRSAGGSSRPAGGSSRPAGGASKRPAGEPASGRGSGSVKRSRDEPGGIRRDRGGKVVGPMDRYRGASSSSTGSRR